MPASEADRQLVMRIRAGEAEAWQQCIDLYEGRLLAFARAHGADGIVTSAGTDPRVAAICEVLEQELPVEALEPQPFVELDGPADLGRFSRYWRRAEREVWAAWSPG